MLPLEQTTMFDLGTIWLKISYYTLSNRQQLRKWYVIGLIAACVFVVVFVITNVVIYSVASATETRLIASMAGSPVPYPEIRERVKPSALVTTGSFAVPLTSGKYHAVVRVKNVNQQWAVRQVTYRIEFGGETTDPQTGMISPNSETLLAALNLAGPAGATGDQVRLLIDSVQWQRIDDHNKIQEVDFSVDQVDYSTSAAGGVTAHLVDGQITNRSLNSFWRAEFVVVLYNGESIVGITYVSYEKFLSGESRALHAQLDSEPTSVSGVAVFPVVDTLDSGNLISN